MNHKQAKKWLPLLTSLAESKQIQIYKQDMNSSSMDYRWINTDSIDVCLVPEYYRVAPEVVKATAYAVVSIGTGSIVALYTDEYDAITVKNSYRDSANWTVVKLEGTYER